MWRCVSTECQPLCCRPLISDTDIWLNNWMNPLCIFTDVYYQTCCSVQERITTPHDLSEQTWQPDALRQEVQSRGQTFSFYNLCVCKRCWNIFSNSSGGKNSVPLQLDGPCVSDCWFVHRLRLLLSIICSVIFYDFPILKYSDLGQLSTLFSHQEIWIISTTIISWRHWQVRTLWRFTPVKTTEPVTQHVRFKTTEALKRRLHHNI